MSCRELFGWQLPLPQALEKDFNAAKQAFNGELLTLQACKSLSMVSASNTQLSFVRLPEIIKDFSSFGWLNFNATPPASACWKLAL